MLKDIQSKSLIIIKKITRSIVLRLLNVNRIILIGTYSHQFIDIYYE